MFDLCLQTRADEADSRARLSFASKDELRAALEQAEVRRAATEAALRVEADAHQQAHSDSVHVLRMSVEAAQRASERNAEVPCGCYQF